LNELGGGILAVQRMVLAVHKMALLTEVAEGMLTSNNKFWHFNHSSLQRKVLSMTRRVRKKHVLCNDTGISNF
jgi:hypothetical protein